MDRDIAASLSRPASIPFESPIPISFLITMCKNATPSKLMSIVYSPFEVRNCSSVLNAEKEVCYEKTEVHS
jgi:hypothetical protein